MTIQEVLDKRYGIARMRARLGQRIVFGPDPRASGTKGQVSQEEGQDACSSVAWIDGCAAHRHCRSRVQLLAEQVGAYAAAGRDGHRCDGNAGPASGYSCAT